jgi:hypothetical protein
MNRNLRYQKGLTMNYLFPKLYGKCACRCGRELTGKRSKWASDFCRDKAFIKFAIIKGDSKIIRNEVFKRDEGFCSICGQYDINWQADHIIPVKNGGGGFDLRNFQTLCLDCHKAKTYKLSHHKAISSQAAKTRCILLACEPGADSSCFLKISYEKHIVRSAI